MSGGKKEHGNNADTVTANAAVTVVGPIAPWRLPLTLAATALTSGSQLVDATASGAGVETALGRSIGVAVITWMALGGINRVIAQAEAQRLVSERTATRAARIAADLEAAEAARAAEQDDTDADPATDTSSGAAVPPTVDQR